MSTLDDPLRFRPADATGSADLMATMSGNRTPPTATAPGVVQPGKVWLVGAGQCDQDLLTVKAARALQQARLVVYDPLVSLEVVRLAGAGADLLYVGKEAGRHTLPQGDLCALMVRLAREGRSLVRLKGGDPYVFGRGGEEAQALAAAGIPFEVVPGISAAQGASAACGIPLTHRDHAAALVLVTGHAREDGACRRDGDPDPLGATDWAALARPHQTVVFYMGLSRLSLIAARLVAHGLDARTPAALVENATTPHQRCVRGALADMPALAGRHGVAPPALLMVGGVVGLQAELAPALAVRAAALAEAG